MTDVERDDVQAGLAAVVAVVLAALASLFLAFVGLVTQTRYSANGARTVRHVSLWQSRGVSALLALSIPVLIAVVALVATRTSSRATVPWVSTALLWLWVVAFLTTIGGFYVPAAIAATFSAVTAGRRRSARTRMPVA
jgi:hypothetical protein